MCKYFFIAVLLYINSIGSAQKLVENLVFEGAGIRGIAYCGAINILQKEGRLDGIKRVGGTSAGAITALMISFNYTAEEIANIISNTNFKHFNDGNLFFAGGTNRLNKYFGWYRDKRFDRWLRRIISAKTGNADITFLQLKEKGFKDLYITGTSINQQKPVLFSYENFPQMKVKDAVRISMSIPLYFEAVFMDNKGSLVYHPKNKEGLQVMVDGGIVANFPIKIFDSTKYLGAAKTNHFKINNRTLGFRIDSDEQINNDSLQKGLAMMPIKDLKDYIYAFYTIIIENLNRQTLTPDDWSRTISISDGKISPRIRKLSANEINLLIENGKKATIKALNQ